MENGKIPPWVRKVNTGCAWIMELEMIPKEEHQLWLRDKRHLWCHQQLRGLGQLHFHPRVPLDDQQDTTWDRLPGGRDCRGRDLLRRPLGRDLHGGPYGRSPWDHLEAHQDHAHGVQQLQQEAQGNCGESSLCPSRRTPTCLRRWSNMDGSCSPSTTTRDGTLTSQLIAVSSWTFKIEYAQTSSGTAQSALSGHLCNSWTWLSGKSAPENGSSKLLEATTWRTTWSHWAAQVCSVLEDPKLPWLAWRTMPPGPMPVRSHDGWQRGQWPVHQETHKVTMHRWRHSKRAQPALPRWSLPTSFGRQLTWSWKQSSSIRSLPRCFLQLPE